MSHYLNVLADASSKGSVLVSIDNAPSQLQLTLLCIRQHILKGPVWVALYNTDALRKMDSKLSSLTEYKILRVKSASDGSPPKAAQIVLTTHDIFIEHSLGGNFKGQSVCIIHRADMLDELMTRKSITKLSRTATSTLVLIASPGISSDAISRLESKLSVKWINVARDEDVKSSVQHIVEYNQDGILSNHEKDTFKSLLETFKLKEPEKDHMSNLDERKGMSHKAREIIETMGAWCATQYTSDALSIRLSKKRKTEPVSEIQTQVDLSRDLSQKLQCLLDLVRRVLAKPDFKLVIVVEKRVAAQLLSKLLHHLSFTLLKGVLVAYSLGNRSASMPNVSLRFDKSLDDFRRGLVNTLVISSGVAKMGLIPRCTSLVIADNTLSSAQMLQIQQHVSEKFYVMINYQDDTEIRRLVRHRIFQIQSGHQAKTKRLVLQNRCTVTRSITEDHVSGIFLHDYFDVYMPSDFIGMDAEIQEILGEVLMEITIEDHPFGFVARLEVTIPDESSPITFQSTVKASPKLARDSLLCVIHQHLVSKGTIYGGNQGLVKSTPMDMAASDEDFSCSDMLYSRQTPACLHYSLWPNETPLMLHVLYLQPLEATSRRSFAMLTPAPIHSSDLCELPVEAFSIPYSSSVEGIDITHIQFELLMRFQAKLWSILNLSSLRSETPSKAYLVSPTKRTEDKWYIDWKFTAAFCNEEPEELKTAETVIERLCANPESATLPFEEFYDILKPGAVPDLTKFSNAKGVIDSTLKSLILKSTRKSMLYECFGVEETLTLDSTFVAPRIQEDPISYRHYFTNMGYKFDDSHPILLKVRALKAEGFEAHSRDEPVSFSYHLASSCTVQPFSRDWLYLASQLPLSLSTLEQHLSLLEFRKSVNLERISLWKLLECFTTPITRQEPNYERLEFLGDSFIKFATTFSLWTDHPGLCEGNLSQLRARKVCNQNLYRLGSELGLGNYLLVNSLRSKSWIPPFRQGKVVLSLLTVKTIADCFEAFVGALFLDAGVQACFSFLARLGLVSQASIDRLYDVVHGITFPPGLNLDEYVEIEQSLGYSFEDPNLLWISLCKSNSDGRGTETLDRLEFLGDAVLELCVTIYLFRKYPDKPPGQLTDIRQSIVNNKNFARLANKHGLLVLSKDCIANRSRESLGKFASDIWEAVAGAVFVDTNFDLENFWQVYEPLLASERSSLSVGPNHQNPSRLLNEISQRRENRGKDLEFSYESAGERQVHCIVTFGGEILSRGTAGSKKLARAIASEKAVRVLL